MLNIRIAELRKQKQISQEQLADVLNTTRQAISKWERGECYPDIERLKELAVFFNVSIDYLLGYDMESVSVSKFISSMEESVKSDRADVSLDTLQLVVSANPNHYALLCASMDYLAVCYNKTQDPSIPDKVIEYASRALSCLPPDNAEEEANNVKRAIVYAYALKGDYASAKAYILKNKLPRAEEILAECEVELGEYEEASNHSSQLFLHAILLITNGQFSQLRVLAHNNQVKDALNLSTWCLSFLKSIGKEEDVFPDVAFIFTFAKAVFQKCLKQDYSEALSYLKENANQSNFLQNSGDLRFYYDKEVRLISLVGDMKKTLEKRLLPSLEGTDAYEDCKAVLKEIYGG